jgi:hypothetical protein
MRKIRDMLRLTAAGMSSRKIAASPASLFQTIASRTSAPMASALMPCYEKTLALVDVCVNRIGKHHSMVPLDKFRYFGFVLPAVHL